VQPILLEAIGLHMPSIIPLRATTISFGNAVPGGPAFFALAAALLAMRQMGHLSAFRSMAAKFLRKIHGILLGTVSQSIFCKIPERRNGSVTFDCSTAVTGNSFLNFARKLSALRT
jgi:hypothetical protein